jgi:GNAT superfamily N-acetyltransferase
VLATSFHRALGYLRRHGLRRTLGRVVVRLFFSSYDFIITRAALEGPPVPQCVGDVTLRPATPVDLQRLGELEGPGRRRVEDGDWLFVACHGERVVAARVMMRAVPIHLTAAKVLRLAPGQAWDEDMFCAPDFRGKGVARHLSLFSDRYLRSLGYTEIFASISTNNVPSLRMQVHKGSEFAYHVSYLRLLFFKRIRVSRQIPRGKPGSDVIASLPLWRGPAS